MAVFASGSHLPLRIFLASACVLSSALLLQYWLPTVVEFAAALLPPLFDTASACLRPPYLYILINCIILCIVASSKFQHGGPAGESPPLPGQKVVAAVVVPKEVDDVPLEYAGYEGSGYVYGVAEELVVAEASSEAEEEEKVVVAEEGSIEEAAAVVVTDAAVVPDSMSELQRSDSVEFAVTEEDTKEKEKRPWDAKPPFSTRFGHRRSAKSSPEAGKALRVSRTRRHDTLESTWRAITDGRAMPLTRHLRKSDTWETHRRRAVTKDDDDNDKEGSPPRHKMNKSETFDEGTGSKTMEQQGDAGKKMRREPSAGQEELNRRVEEFIRKFNEEMRLQREESLNQFQEMISRGTG